MLFSIISAIVTGYLLGSLPFAYIAGRFIKGVDIRQVGGGNMGTLNTLREIGLLPGLLVLLTDITKGAVAVLFAIWLGIPLVWVLATGFAAISGHVWSVFLKFKGGKGAAITLGVLLALLPAEMGICLGVIALFVIITSNVRLAVTIGLVLLPITIWQLNGSGVLITYSLALALFLLALSIPDIRKATTDSQQKKNLFFDRDYHFWQTRKKT